MLTGSMCSLACPAMAVTSVDGILVQLILSRPTIEHQSLRDFFHTSSSRNQPGRSRSNIARSTWP